MPSPVHPPSERVPRLSVPDPVRFEVLRNALLAITEEMGATLRRAAYSTNIKTRGDFSCAILDRNCRLVAQAFAQPSHLGSLVHIVPQAVARYGRDNLVDGDGLLTNDPYTGGVHLNDITFITPVFYQGELFAFLANVAHHVDVGGGAPGSIGVSSEIYQEGLVIPPVRFVRDGAIDPNLFQIIRANFRGVYEISGDFRAQTAANRLGVARIQELLDRYGPVELETYMNALLDYTERRIRAEFARFPEGRYSANSFMDSDGVSADPIPFEMTVNVKAGAVKVDLSRCVDQRPSPTNATFSQTYSGVVFVLKCLVDPDIPVNDGLYRLVDIHTRPGSIVHAQHPAAVAAGWEVAVHVCDLMFKALASALPDRALACGKGIMCNLAFGGKDPRTGDYFTYYETLAGGYGATRRTDGMDAVQAHFQNTENAPVEETEFNYPVRIPRYELVNDSEGAG
ncbi:MAG: hydantoinase B/oxoprolinase family protein, partial [Deltaproteobacteria bacterium]|nr:hydantoinase B/oxoprolinase family protein [Deltaproteobacteria bacterium]